MIDKISTNAKMNSNDVAHIGLFTLIRIAFKKINEIVSVVNKLERDNLNK